MGWLKQQRLIRGLFQTNSATVTSRVTVAAGVTIREVSFLGGGQKTVPQPLNVAVLFTAS